LAVRWSTRTSAPSGFSKTARGVRLRFPARSVRGVRVAAAELERSTTDPLGPILEFEFGELDGLRLADRWQDGDGTTLVRIRHFVFDHANRDIHLIVTHAEPEVAEQAFSDLIDLLETPSGRGDAALTRGRVSGRAPDAAGFFAAASPRLRMTSSQAASLRRAPAPRDPSSRLRRDSG